MINGIEITRTLIPFTSPTIHPASESYKCAPAQSHLQPYGRITLESDLMETKFYDILLANRLRESCQWLSG